MRKPKEREREREREMGLCWCHIAGSHSQIHNDFTPVTNVWVSTLPKAHSIIECG